MTFNYNNILKEKLIALQADLGLSNFDFEVDYEQAFIKEKDMAPGTIYVLTKNLQNDRSVGVVTQPVQIMILAEQNSLDIAKLVFSEFAKRNNFVAMSINGSWMKQQYSDPVVLSNFNTVDYGYRSVLYVSATLYIMDDVIDVSEITIDTAKVEALNFNFSYSMTTNTQPKTTEAIASSLKTVSSFAITMTVPLVNTALVQKVLNIVNETTGTVNYTGNEGFDISFKCSVGNEVNDFSLTISKTMRLISAQLTTAPNQVPALQLGFMK